jgi:hypothetical protein
MGNARNLGSFLGNNTSLSTINDAYDAGALSNRNLIINGAMQVAQRGTTSTSDQFQTVDRFQASNAGLDEAVTQEHHTLTSSGDTEVWNLGFRKSYKLTNGNQTSGGGADDRVTMQYRIEGQDITNSSWNYASSSSDVTLSFWCKSSVAQNFYARLQSYGSTNQVYVIETGSLTANTWTKITKTIPGASGVAFENNNSLGALLEFIMFRGTNKTGTRALNVWEEYDTNIRVPDMTSTWYTTDDATFEITGVQLEVGDTATPFEHRSYGEELAKCQRYFQVLGNNQSNGAIASGYFHATTSFRGQMSYLQRMRAAPTGSTSTVSGFILQGTGGNFTPTSIAVTVNFTEALLVVGIGPAQTAGQGANLLSASGTAIYLDAEL